MTSIDLIDKILQAMDDIIIPALAAWLITLIRSRLPLK